MPTTLEKTVQRIDNLPLQDASEDIWDKKYRLKKECNEAVDQTIQETFERVAQALADVEDTAKKKAHWKNEFVWALNRGALPAGRILSNAGASKYKPATSTINCTVSGIVGDSMHDILEKNTEAGLTLKAGCGIGYEFSTLRPKGDYVSGAGATTSGPLSFMDIFDKTCFTVSSAGGRRGAQMATFDVGHPDVIDFIRAKKKMHACANSTSPYSLLKSLWKPSSQTPTGTWPSPSLKSHWPLNPWTLTMKTASSGGTSQSPMDTSPMKEAKRLA